MSDGEVAKDTRRQFSTETKIAAAEEVKAGTPPTEVQKKYGVVSSVLLRWRRQYEAGLYSKLPPGATNVRGVARAQAVVKVKKKKAAKSKRGGTAGRKATHHRTDAEKLAILAEVDAHEGPIREVLEKHEVSNSLYHFWRKKVAAGELQGATPPRSKAKGVVSAEAAPVEDALARRVKRAMITLRDAWRQVEEMQEAGVIKKPDNAHLLMELALRTLEGSYGR